MQETLNSYCIAGKNSQMEIQESTPYQNSFLILLPPSPKIPYTDEFEDPRPTTHRLQDLQIRYIAIICICAL